MEWYNFLIEICSEKRNMLKLNYTFVGIIKTLHTGITKSLWWKNFVDKLIFLLDSSTAKI